MALNNPYALSFDGVDDYVQIPASALVFGSNPRTYSIYFDADKTAGASMHVLAYGQGLAGRAFGLFKSAANHLYLNLYGDTAIYLYELKDNYTGGWVDLIYDGTLFEAFCDGEKVFSQNIAIDTGVSAYGRLGHRFYYAPAPTWYKGVIDEFRSFNYALSAAELSAYRYRYLSGNEAGLLGLYRFDSGSGNIAIDSSPNANHGTIYGATWVPGIVDLHLPGEVPISAILHGSSNATAKADHIRGLSAHLAGAATATGGTPIRIRGLTANLQGAGTTKARMNLIAALKASLQGKAALKSNILVLFIPEGIYVIDADEIFAKNQPSRGQVVANYIEVWINPLKPVEVAEEVYRSKDPITIPAGETKTITIHFDDEPVTEPAVTLEEAGANLSITATKYYAWGADVTIRNSGSSEQTCIIVANGRPLKVQGREKVIKEDPISIQENGIKKYEFDNPFVQDRATAEMIAERLLSYANARRDISIEWRGDPALELADVTMIPEYQRRGLDQRGIFYITKQELEFDGGLRAKLEGRKM